LLVIVGVLLLLHNFLLLGDFNIIDLWPLILVIIGLQLLLRGDITPSNTGRTFGITRGSVQSGTLDVQAGDIDLIIGTLDGTERLIAGQYALQTRPKLEAIDTHAHIIMRRSQTPWISFADWELGLAKNMPWEAVLSTHIGQIDFDASGIILERTLISTGLGDIRFVCPHEALGNIEVHSVLGTIQIVAPPEVKARIIIRPRRFSKIHTDMGRYTPTDDGAYLANSANESSEMSIFIDSIVGDVYLI
jgi:hypothetical protein